MIIRQNNLASLENTYSLYSLAFRELSLIFNSRKLSNMQGLQFHMNSILLDSMLSALTKVVMSAKSLWLEHTIVALFGRD